MRRLMLNRDLINLVLKQLKQVSRISEHFAVFFLKLQQAQKNGFNMKELTSGI